MWRLSELLVTNRPLTFLNGKWVEARPENFKRKYCPIWKRAAYAWRVLIGKEETFVWPEGQ